MFGMAAVLACVTLAPAEAGTYQFWNERVGGGLDGWGGWGSHSYNPPIGAGSGSSSGNGVFGNYVSVQAQTSGGGGGGEAWCGGTVWKEKDYKWIAAHDEDWPETWHVRRRVSGDGSASANVGGQLEECRPYANSSASAGAYAGAWWEHPSDSSGLKTWSGTVEMEHYGEQWITNGASSDADAYASVTAPYLWHWEYDYQTQTGWVVIDHTSSGSSQSSANGRIDEVSAPISGPAPPPQNP